MENGVESRADSRQVGFWAWMVCGMLFAATVLNYLDRQTLSVCAPLICREFNLSDEQYGQLVSAFRWAYAALHVPAGYLADRWPVSRVLGWSVVFWSVAGASTAFSRGFGSLIASRAALGVGEAFNWPCALRVTANILPPEDRALGNGVFQSGTAIGALVAPLIIAPLAVQYGWRVPFLIVGAAGGIWVLGWLVLCAQRQAATGLADASSQATSLVASRSLMIRLRSIAATPGFWLLLVAAGAINPCWYFLAEWLSKYLHDQHRLDVLWAGLATTPIFLGADVGNIGGGAIVRILARRGLSVPAARSISASGGAALAATAAFVGRVDSATLCVAILVTSALGVAVLMSNWLSCIQDVAIDDVGLVMGLLGGFGCVVGATVNPWIGRYVDRLGHYDLVFVLLGLLPIVTLVCILLFDEIIRRRHAT
jgi:MFS transporter, ACS family, hexuronate transporter